VTPEEIATNRTATLDYWKRIAPEIHDAYVAFYEADDAEQAAYQRRRDAWRHVDTLVDQRLETQRHRTTPAH
jgi:hypothetical protein